MIDTLESVRFVRTVDDLPPQTMLDPLLAASAASHRHCCPRQVLGVRMALRGLQELGFVDESYGPRFHNDQKQLLTIVETDGCGADGIAVTADCHVGRRTLRVEDYGKVAATFVDRLSGRAIRVAPLPDVRERIHVYAPEAPSGWHAYLEAYQIMPDSCLLQVRSVFLEPSLEEILSRPGMRVVCDRCREEIINEREVYRGNQLLCRSCAGDSYYKPRADLLG